MAKCRVLRPCVNDHNDLPRQGKLASECYRIHSAIVTIADGLFGVNKQMAKKKAIEPGKPVRNSKSGQPIMVALDLLGRRWSLRILWSLRNGERQSSRMLQNECGISSPNVMNSRLRDLRGAGIVDLEEGGGYRLTKEGRDLLKALGPLAAWADGWARSVGRDDLACYSRSVKK